MSFFYGRLVYHSAQIIVEISCRHCAVQFFQNEMASLFHECFRECNIMYFRPRDHCATLGNCHESLFFLFSLEEDRTYAKGSAPAPVATRI
jgi:hypothetical protein